MGVILFTFFHQHPFDFGDFKEGSNAASNDYTYDVNGNLTQDLNKNISAIGYNYLNLPFTIAVTGQGSIVCTCDAAGNKIKKTTTETGANVLYNGVTTASDIITTTYIGPMVYESKNYVAPALAALDYTDRLQFILQEEGRIRFEKCSTATCTAQPDCWLYDYFLKDHLGNIRTVLTEQKEDICYLSASVEDATYQTEDDIYTIVEVKASL